MVVAGIGRQFGPYHIVSPLGAGGMGEVYRAHDSKLDVQAYRQSARRRKIGEPRTNPSDERMAIVAAGSGLVFMQFASQLGARLRVGKSQQSNHAQNAAK